MEKAVRVDEGPIGKTLLAFALPVLVTQLLQELYNAADCAVLGHFGEPGALAATGIAGLLLSVFINFFIGFSSGVSAVTAKLFGADDIGKLRQTMTSVFRLVFAFGVLLSILGFAASDALLGLLRCPESVRPPAAAYLRIVCCGIAAQLFYNVGAAVLRSLGDSRGPLRCFFFSCALNLALDALLVIGLHRGVRGAAAATLASQWLLAALLLRRLTTLDKGCALGLTGKGLSPKELFDILKIGLPAGMQALFMSISSLLIQTCIDAFGPDAMAGMTLYAKLEGCLYLPAFAYGIALTGFCRAELRRRTHGPDHRGGKTEPSHVLGGHFPAEPADYGIGAAFASALYHIAGDPAQRQGSGSVQPALLCGLRHESGMARRDQGLRENPLAHALHAPVLCRLPRTLVHAADPGISDDARGVSEL